jgi:hypothetical protein
VAEHRRRAFRHAGLADADDMDHEHELDEAVSAAVRGASMPPAAGDGRPETQSPDDHETGGSAPATAHHSLIPPAASLQSSNSQGNTSVSSSSWNDAGSSPVIRVILDSWWLELVCLGVVVLALVAIALTLFHSTRTSLAALDLQDLGQLVGVCVCGYPRGGHAVYHHRRYGAILGA